MTSPEPSAEVLEFERRAAHLVMKCGKETKTTSITEKVFVLPGLKISGVVQTSNSIDLVGGEHGVIHEFIIWTQMVVFDLGKPGDVSTPQEIYYKSTRADKVETFRWNDDLVCKWLPALEAAMVLDDLSSIQ